MPQKSELEEQVRQQLASLIRNHIQIGDFCDWFYPETWGVDGSAPDSLQKLVYRIDLRLAEYSSGHLPLDKLKAQMVGEFAID